MLSPEEEGYGSRVCRQCNDGNQKILGLDPRDYDIHLNFPGGIPMDGPSAGVTIAVSVYSSIKNLPVDNYVAMTGELSVRGYVSQLVVFYLK